MSYHYSDKSREKDPRALPNIEVFFKHGWYWWSVCPGDQVAIGPFTTEAEAITDAQSGNPNEY